MKNIFLILLTFLFFLSSKAQTEYRVGLGLFEMTNIPVGYPFPYPIGGFTTHQVANSLFLERHKNRITHRVSARYFNVAHSLKESDFRPDGDVAYKGNFERWAWDAGYTFLYSFGQQKRLSLGAGLSYLQDHQQSYSIGPEYTDFLNHSIAPSLSLEANFKVLQTWYINPSLSYTYSHSLKFQERANTPSTFTEKPDVAYITFFKLSIKKMILKKD